MTYEQAKEDCKHRVCSECNGLLVIFHHAPDWLARCPKHPESETKTQSYKEFIEMRESQISKPHKPDMDLAKKLLEAP